MGGGGGGALNKLFPGYKDKIWAKVPVKVRELLINRWNNAYSAEYYKLCVVENMRIRWLHKNVVEPLKPDYSYRMKAVDYKRQIARGTLVEGVDGHSHQGMYEKRLRNHFEPYSEEEMKERRQHRYYSLKWGLGCALFFGVIYELNEKKRPIVWCLEKEPPHPPHYPFWFKSIFHSHDIPSVRRGFEVYRKVCATCHSMEQLHFRHLVNEVLPEKRVKQIAASYDIVDGPNDEGEMFTRPGILTDAFPACYPNDEAARYANGGALPPDLSLMAAARHNGPDYMFALLTGYRDPPEGVELRPGLYYNTYFPGGAIAMPPPLMDDMIEYEDGTPANASQMAKDVVNFLTWASEPIHDERKLTGLKAVSAAFLGMCLMTVWYRFFKSVYDSRRIDFGSLKYI